MLFVPDTTQNVRIVSNYYRLCIPADYFAVKDHSITLRHGNFTSRISVNGGISETADSMVCYPRTACDYRFEGPAVVVVRLLT